MHLLLSGQEFAKKKTNKRTNDNKKIIRFFYQIALYILFFRRAHFLFEAFRIQVTTQSKLKKKKGGGDKLYRILRSFLFGRGPNRVMETACFDANVQ